MAEHPNQALKDKLEADRDALEPAIRGLRDIAATSVTPALSAALLDAASVRERRRNFLQLVIDNLDVTQAALVTLEADGYPDLAAPTISERLMQELGGESNDLQAAVAVFHPDQAARINIGFGNPVPKEPPQQGD